MWVPNWHRSVIVWDDNDISASVIHWLFPIICGFKTVFTCENGIEVYPSLNISSVICLYLLRVNQCTKRTVLPAIMNTHAMFPSENVSYTETMIQSYDPSCHELQVKSLNYNLSSQRHYVDVDIFSAGHLRGQYFTICKPGHVSRIHLYQCMFTSHRTWTNWN